MPGVKKEQLEKAAKEALPPLTEITKQDLLRDDAVFFIGLMAAKSLMTFGQITLVMGASETVCVANPTQVYLDAGAILDDEDLTELPPYKWVRPILASGRPQYVAWRDGELWEIEFEDDLQEQEDPGGSNHP